MSYALFITRDNIIKNTVLQGSIDADTLLPFVRLSQDKYLLNILGTVLYNKINDDIISDPTLSGYTCTSYSTLMNHIKNMLVWCSVCEYIPFSSIQFKSDGAYQIATDSYQAPSKTNLDYLLQKAMDNMEYYTKVLVEFLEAYSSEIVEYNQTTGKSNNIYPDNSDSYFCGIGL